LEVWLGGLHLFFREKRPKPNSTVEKEGLNIQRTVQVVEMTNSKIPRSQATMKASEADEGDQPLQLPTTQADLRSQTLPGFQSIEWYEGRYRNTALMLFRPLSMLADVSKDSKTLEKTFVTSKQAILLHASLHGSKKINYCWITLHSLFMAGYLTNMHLSRHFHESRRQFPFGAILPSDLSTIEIVYDTRACSNVLVAVSKRWNTFRHSH
jgi:hypothetical protein